MQYKMSLLLDKIQQACDVEIWYNIMQYKMSLLLDKIQQARDVEIWYNTVLMSEIFEIDRAKCVKCGACVRDCFFRALGTGEDGSPRFAHPERCMRCQHCFAVCPTGAVTFDGRRPEDSIPLKGLELPSLEAVENWLRARRSVRRFAAEDVDQELLGRILRTLGNCPTGCNARSLTFTCFPTREATDRFRCDFVRAIEKHRDGNRLLPRWLAIPAIKLRKSGEDMDVTIACSHFEMLASAAGIATCWCGFLGKVQEAVPELLEVTVGICRTTPFYAMLFGRPAIRYARSVQRDAYANIDLRK